tara:strand:- start:970 stop:1173 length:204 start_codon:yes stop_codon:yes gene_type:complete
MKSSSLGRIQTKQIVLSQQRVEEDLPTIVVDITKSDNNKRKFVFTCALTVSLLLSTLILSLWYILSV